VVFLHGWGLGSRAYRRPIRRLARRGCRVFAPSLPGLGGTPDLPRDALCMAGYADWVDEFLTAVGVEEAALVIGHSFGGGVATKLAHAHPERVGYLVLLNSVGALSNRPFWTWPMHLAKEILPGREGIELVLAGRQDLFDNIVRNPCGLIRIARLARAADLSVELAELRRRALPVLALTTDGDAIIPHPAFTALCRAIGTDGQVLNGRHTWLLSHPDTFGQVLGNVLEVRVADHQQRGAQTRSADIADALRETTIPARTARSLLRQAPALWLMSAPVPVLAADLALCHPRLGPGEVRAVARPNLGSLDVRLTVIAADRPGLLADTAGAITTHGMSVSAASAATWPGRGMALHALTVQGADGFAAEDWERLGADLGKLGRASRPKISPVRAAVSVYGAGGDRSLVRLTAPDQVGLLWAISDWFAGHGVSIESLDASTTDGVAHDVFLVCGTFEGSELRRHLVRGAVPSGDAEPRTDNPDGPPGNIAQPSKTASPQATRGGRRSALAEPVGAR